MSSDAGGDGGRILGSLRAVDGNGVVRMQDRFDTDIQDCGLPSPILPGWPAGRNAKTPNRILVQTVESGRSDEHYIQASLTADGDHTILVIEERGMPLDQLAAYGAGVQVHVEDLAAHLDGREHCDAQKRWQELFPAYQDLATTVR